MIIENKTLGKYELGIENLTQGDLEMFFKSMREDTNGEQNRYSSPEYQGATLRVAFKMGWVTPTFDVAKAKPALIRFVATEIQNQIALALDIPPN